MIKEVEDIVGATSSS